MGRTRAIASTLNNVYGRQRLTKRQRAARRRLLARRIRPIDIAQDRDIVRLVEGFKDMSIQARRIGMCASVYENMLTDPQRPTVLLGLAGPLIAGGLRGVIRDLIAYGMVDVVVSTGAIMYQDLHQALGFGHFRGTPDADDALLHDLRINRIYDTYVDDEAFLASDAWVSRFAGALEPRVYSSREFLALMGAGLSDRSSILATAARYGVPVFCPALNDSSIGIGLTDHYHVSKRSGGRRITIDPIRDNYELTQIVVKSPCTAAAYIAGGVPKNYINDAVVMGYVLGKDTGGHRYAFQVTTDVPHWGGLSGSTLDEAKSWGKVARTARKAMAFVEPTVSLPLIAGYVMHKGFWRKRRRLALSWDDDTLVSLSVGKRVSVDRV